MKNSRVPAGGKQAPEQRRPPSRQRVPATGLGWQGRAERPRARELRGGGGPGTPGQGSEAGGTLEEAGVWVLKEHLGLQGRSTWMADVKCLIQSPLATRAREPEDLFQEGSEAVWRLLPAGPSAQGQDFQEESGLRTLYSARSSSGVDAGWT